MGQALHAAARPLRWLWRLAAVLLILLPVAAAVLAWRLDQGPLPLPWLAHRIEAMATARGVPLHVASASLAWSGFRHGLHAPLQVTLSGLHVSGPDPAASPVVAAEVSAAFVIPDLLAGHFVPRGIGLDGLRVTLTREASGQLTLGTQRSPGPSLPRATGSKRGRSLDWTTLQHLHVHDVAVAVYDAPLGISWAVSRADADLDRDRDGALHGEALIAVQAAAQRATLNLTARQHSGGSSIKASLTTLNPAALAALSPILSPLGALDAPVTLAASAETDAAFGLRQAHVTAAVGAGRVQAGRGSAPLLTASLVADITSDGLVLTQHLETAATPAAARTTVQGTLQASRAATGWVATERATLDRLAFADLPALWPEGTGGPGTRPWISKSIPAGTLTGGRLTLSLALPPDLSDAKLTAIDGGIDGHDLTVRWLPPVPPIEHADGRLTVTDPDVIDIAVDSARQARPGGGDGLAFSHATVHLTGIAGSDQFADIATTLSGSLPDLIAVLKNPRVKLLDKRPVPMRDAAGSLLATLSVTHLPLRDDVSMDDLHIASKGRFSGVHLGGIAAGRDLDHGDLQLAANNDGLQVAGTATLAGIASQLDVAMDFRDGPPSQIEQKIRVQAAIGAADLERLGLPTRGVLGGHLAVDATLANRRDGHADIMAHANLTEASLDASRLAWSKKIGQAVTGRLHVSLEHDRLSSIDEVFVQGPGVDIEGSGDVTGGQPNVLHLNRLVLAPDTDAHGSVRLPRTAGEPYVVVLRGASLDASGVLQHNDSGSARKPAHARTPPQPEAAGPPWTVDLQLGRVVLGHGRQVEALSAQAENDGRVVRRALVTGVAQSPAPPGAQQRPVPFRLSLVPDKGGRRLAASAPDAGGVLRVLDVARDISGGRMEVTGRYDDTQPSHPLAGTATLHDFRVLDAPVVGRVLQAATLYGVIEVLRGPGLGFSTMVAPFRWEGDTLRLDSARAFSASLGFTAKGSVDLATNRLDMQGTIVPAYFFNTLPGRLPLVGRLFSPEKGGGLFAATYAVRGSFDDPAVSINPLATLTPGFLRGVFGIFGGRIHAAP